MGECLFREPDEVLAEYLRKNYGPYRNGSLIHGTEAVPCDLCGLPVTGWVLLSAREGKHGQLMVCRVNRCLDLILGREEAAKYHVALAGPATRWGSPAEPFDREVMVAAEAEAALLKRHPEVVEAVVVRSRNFLKAGFGRAWKIVPALLEFYTERSELSPKQLAVLERFNHACARDAEL